MKNVNINVETAKTSELLAFYNQHAEKQVSKFTNLETARRRVTALIDSLAELNAAQDVAEQAAAAKTAAKAAKGAKKLVVTVEHQKSIKADPEPKPAKKSAKQELQEADAGELIVAAAPRSNSAGIAASWLDPDVRAARLYRQGVIVSKDGKPVGEYVSTHAAFAALGLPISKVIRFRMKLKAAGGLSFTFGSRTFDFTIL